MTTAPDGETYKQKVKRLMAEPQNARCADCGAEGPDWASTNLGLLICIRCSGIHRCLGVHISKVRSVALDDWDESQWEPLSRIGNVEANKYWEANVPVWFLRPDDKEDDATVREMFIRAKYEQKLFVPEAELKYDFIVEGFLEKEAPGKGRFQQRWFVLTDNLLSYFKSPTDSYPAGVIHLEDATIKFTDACKDGQGGVLVQVPGRDYKLFNKDLTVVIKWIHSLRNAHAEFSKGDAVLRGRSSDKELAKAYLEGSLESPVIMEGFLTKQGGSIKNWKKRWAVLKEGALLYYKNQGDPAPAGVVPLVEGSVKEVTDDRGMRKPNAFIVSTADRQYYFTATDSSELHNWVKKINEQCGSTRVATPEVGAL